MSEHSFLGTKFKFILPFIAAIFAGLFYVLSELWGRYGISAYTMGVCVNILGGVFLLLVSYKKLPSFKIEKKDIGKLLLSSLFGFALGYFFLYQAIDIIGSSRTSFIAQVEPIFVFILSCLFLKEKFSLKNLFSLGIILSGVFFILFDPAILNISLGAGEIYSALSGLSFALGIISITKVVSKYDEFIITGLQMIGGGVILMVFIPLFGFDFKIQYLIPLTILGIIIGLSRLFYNLGLKTLGAAKTAIIYTSKSFIVFLFAILASKIFSNIHFKIPQNIPLFIAGGSIVLLGIIVLRYKKKGGPQTGLLQRQRFVRSFLHRKSLFKTTVESRK